MSKENTHKHVNDYKSHWVCEEILNKYKQCLLDKQIKQKHHGDCDDKQKQFQDCDVICRKYWSCLKLLDKANE